jgi:hypothetical protein
MRNFTELTVFGHGLGCRDELYKECLGALEGGALLESDDLHEAEEALSRAFLEADKRLISRFVVQNPYHGK